MKQYVEAHEIIPSGVNPDEYVPEFYRLEVTTTVEDAVNDLKSMLDANKSYRIVRHDCYHEDGKSCVIELLEIYP